MNLLKYFIRAPKYKNQILNDKALNIINTLDEYLVETNTNGFTKFSILHLQLNIFDQLKPTEVILEFFKQNITPNYHYMPRSIAHTVDANGTWHFYIGLYRPDDLWNVFPQDDVKNQMWLDLLCRTNDARA